MIVVKLVYGLSRVVMRIMTVRVCCKVTENRKVIGAQVMKEIGGITNGIRIDVFRLG